MSISKVRLPNNTEEDIKAKYLVTSSEITPTERSITSGTSGVSQDMGEAVATVQKIKGNTIKWNQLVQNGNFSNGTNNWALTPGTMSVSNGVCTVTINSTSGSACITQDVSIVSGHKYYISFIINSSVTGYVGYFSSPTQWFGSLTSSDLNKDFRFSTVIQAGSNKTKAFFGSYPTGVNGSYKISNIWIADLTEIYGSGNEPTAIQFEAQYPSSYYTYDAGSLYGTTVQSIKSIGFNQWDEQWEVGFYSTTSGNPAAANDSIRSKNRIPIIGGTAYYGCKPSGKTLYKYFYTASGTFISEDHSLISTAPANASYMNIALPNLSPAVYGNDICINISDASRNGQYEPYKQSICSLNITTLMGKLNGAGSSVTVFPNGVQKNGTTYDELTATTATKKIANDNTILSSPQVYILDTPLNLSYASFYGGTESILPEQTSTITSAPLDAIIFYSAGDVQALIGSQAANISNESLKQLLDAMVTAGVISAYTMVWNAETGKYDFTITS